MSSLLLNKHPGNRESKHCSIYIYHRHCSNTKRVKNQWIWWFNYWPFGFVSAVLGRLTNSFDYFSLLWNLVADFFNLRVYPHTSEISLCELECWNHLLVFSGCQNSDSDKLWFQGGKRVCYSGSSCVVMFCHSSFSFGGQ